MDERKRKLHEAILKELERRGVVVTEDQIRASMIRSSGEVKGAVTPEEPTTCGCVSKA